MLLHRRSRPAHFGIVVVRVLVLEVGVRKGRLAESTLTLIACVNAVPDVTSTLTDEQHTHTKPERDKEEQSDRGNNIMPRCWVSVGKSAGRVTCGRA